MQFTVSGVQQDRLITYGLDVTDAVLLSWFRNFIKSGAMKSYTAKEDGVRCYWVYYQTIIDALPVLKIKCRRVIARRFDKYERYGLIKQHQKQRHESGVRTYFSLIQPAFDELFLKPGDDEALSSRQDGFMNEDDGINSQAARKPDKKFPSKTNGSKVSTSKKQETVYDY